MVRKPVTSKSPPDRSIAMSALVSVKIRKFLSGHGMAANGGLGLHTSINRRFAICNLLLELQKPPAPVALEGRLCLSGKPHEFKRSLITLN